MQAIWSDLPVPSYTYYDYTYYDSSTHSKSKWSDSKDTQEVHLFQLNWRQVSTVTDYRYQ